MNWRAPDGVISDLIIRFSTVSAAGGFRRAADDSMRRPTDVTSCDADTTKLD